MDFEKTMEIAMKAAEDGRIAGHQGMVLKDILSALENANPEAEVSFDFEYMTPSGFSSYRGYYSDLAIEFSDCPSPKCPEFAKELTECIGKEFTGYKGGEFKMDGDSLVWVANYGHSGGTAIVRVTHNDYEVILHTAKID